MQQQTFAFGQPQKKETTGETRRNLVIEAGAGTGKTTAIVAEVLSQKGFLWCKRLRLGVHEFAMLYGIESRAAFEAYEANATLKAKFARERAPFEKHMRIERFFGEAEKSYAA